MNEQNKVNWHTIELSKIYEMLNTNEVGLSKDEVIIRLERDGLNEIENNTRKTILKMVIEQLKDVMVLVLLFASIFSMVLNEWTEAIVILVIIIINLVISVAQEKKAINAIESLKNMNAPNAYVLRDNGETIVPANTLVVGDIIYLEDGSIVPADIRLIEESNLQIDESSLTGESVLAIKELNGLLLPDTLLGDRINMAYSSTVVMSGNGLGVVVATGLNTEVGHIANMLNEQDEIDTPLKRKLNSVGKTLSIVGLIISILIFLIGMLYKRTFISMLMLSIALAISVIPEGLPAIATMIMALGVGRMAKQNALVRKLPSVETLGNATVICSDKTGTLTENKMTVTHLAMYNEIVFGSPILVNNISKDNKYGELLTSAALCNNATIDVEDSEVILGDPTEAALIYLVEKLGINQKVFEDENPKVFEQPFDSSRKMMTSIHKMDNKIIAYTKGAIDELLEKCTNILTPDGVRAITDNDINKIKELNIKMSTDALRVLGFASKELIEVPINDDEDVEYCLTFIGMTGMIDPPRKEVIKAINDCHKAGIRTIMITGDHKVTALAIAKEVGIYKKGNIIMTGAELNLIDDEELDKLVNNIAVFARTSPKDKLRIVNSLKRNGEVVAMTGDGVNDSPALKAADIGIAMGITGTDVAKDASDMILMDDNFTTIEYAIREGRRIYRNIQKIIQFLLAGNIAEVLILFIATIFNWDTPILAIHILLINLVTDTLPALALGIDPASSNIMNHKPVKSGTLFEKGLVIRIILHGIFLTIATLLAHQLGVKIGGAEVGMTMAFTVLVISQLFHSLSQRSNTNSIFQKDNELNTHLYISLIISASILLLILIIPKLQLIFKITPLSGNQWLIVSILSLIPLILVEITKFLKRNVIKVRY